MNHLARLQNLNSQIESALRVAKHENETHDDKFNDYIDQLKQQNINSESKLQA